MNKEASITEHIMADFILFAGEYAALRALFGII